MIPPRTTSAPLPPGAPVAAPYRPSPHQPMVKPLPSAPPGHRPPGHHVTHHHHHHHHHMHHHHHTHHVHSHHAQLGKPFQPEFLSRADPAAAATTSVGQSPAQSPKDASPASVSPAITPPTAAGVSPTSALPPSTAAAVPEEPLIEFPADRVYDRRVMLKYKSMTSDLSDAIRRFGMEMWSYVQDVTDRPEHMQISRDDLFSGSSAAPQSRLIKERQLHHEVLGILARVTPEKYEKLKMELLALPIRQSDEDDIKLVVQTFFQKAIRPEDAPYAEYYVRLISDMINQIGPREPVGNMIRKEIVSQCQTTFQNTDTSLTDPESLKTSDMNDEEFEMRRKQAKDKNKANINFLGLLFINGLVHERVVTNVLFDLLYGSELRRRGRNHHVPADFEVEMFLELLLKTGKKCTEPTRKYFDQFLNTMSELSQSHPSKRIQFKLLDALEIVRNDFETKKAKGPKTLADHENAVQREKNANRDAVEAAIANRRPFGASGPTRQASQPASSIAAPAAGATVKALPSAKEVQDALDKYCDQGIAEAVQLLKEIPDRSTRIDYCTRWMYRPMTVMKLSDLRSKIGEVFAALVSHKILRPEDVRAVVQSHLREIVDKGDYQEQPKYFTNWANVVRNGEEYLTADLHTYLLKLVVQDENSSVEIIQRLITDVNKLLPPSHSDAPRDATARRFRLLPSLLMHRPSLERCLDGDYDPDEDVLAIDDPDPEIAFYNSLFTEETVAELQQAVNKSADRAEISYSTKIVCAIFCYVRFDPQYICQQRSLKDVLKRFQSFTNTRGPLEAAWLAEIYATWRELDRIPSDGFTAFVKWMLDSQLISQASLAAFVQEMAKLGPSGEADSQKIKLLVSSK